MLDFCPKCGSEFVDINSSKELKLSIITCSDCGYEMEAKISKEALVKKWNALKRKDINDYEWVTLYNKRENYYKENL